MGLVAANNVKQLAARPKGVSNTLDPRWYEPQERLLETEDWRRETEKRIND